MIARAIAGLLLGGIAGYTSGLFLGRGSESTYFLFPLLGASIGGLAGLRIATKNYPQGRGLFGSLLGGLFGFIPGYWIGGISFDLYGSGPLFFSCMLLGVLLGGFVGGKIAARKTYVVRPKN